MARIHESSDEKESSSKQPQQQPQQQNKGIIPSACGTALGFLRAVKRRVEYEFTDDDRFAFNMKLAKAVGMFGGSILLMRTFGDSMAI